MACSTIVEYSQQEGFYRVSLPAARQTPNLEDQSLEVPTPALTSETNPSSGRWNYGREIAEEFAESGDFHVNFGFFYMRHGTEGVLRIFSPEKSDGFGWV
jgi:hypothetical protein